MAGKRSEVRRLLAELEGRSRRECVPSLRRAQLVVQDVAVAQRLFRHTYCAARLQTLDRGAPVSLYTVSRELGHGSEDMVRRVYAHLGGVRHRADVVEFRVEQHVERLGDRLPKLGLPMPSVTRNVTTEGEEEGMKTPDASELTSGEQLPRAGDRTRTGDVQLGKLAFYH